MAYCSHCGFKVDGAFCSNCGRKVGETAKEVETVDSCEKEVLLNTLYVLRAGISRISQKSDEARKFEQEKGTVSDQASKKGEEIKRLGEKFRAAQCQCTREISDSDYEQAMRRYEQDLIKARRKDRGLNAIHRISIVFLWIFGFFSVMLLFPAIAMLQNIKQTYSIIMLSVYAVVVIITISAFVVRYNSYGYAESRLRHKFENDYAKPYEASKKAELARFSIPKEIEGVEKTKERLLCHVSKCEENIKVLAVESKKIYDGLADAFGKIVNPRDWGNIDTIIYCLETGRADTLKEAIQQTDMVVRHEEMKAVMLEVGRKICSAISSYTSQLSLQMENMADSQRMFATEMKKINDNLLSSAEMQKALLAKANENSKKLMEDVNKMRSYSDVMAKKTGISL